jgi:hypothetical protein
VNHRERQDLDRHITGNDGEDFFEEPEMTDAQEADIFAAVREEMEAAYGDLGLPPEDVVTADPEDDGPFLPEDDEE